MQQFRPFKDDLFEGSPIGGAYFEISLNDKLGDLIIFNYGKLSFLRERFQKVIICNAAPPVLNKNKYISTRIPELIDSDSLFKNVLDTLEATFQSHGEQNSFVFIECGSIRRRLIKIGIPSDEAALHTMKFLIKLTELIKTHGWHFILWRNPFKNSAWGLENFTFAFDNTNFKELISLDHPDLCSRIHPDQGVYEVAKVVYQALWGESREYRLSESDLDLKEVSSSLPQGPYVIFNFNTGESTKRAKVAQHLKKMLEEIASAKSISPFAIYISRPETYWQEDSKSQVNEFAKAPGVNLFSVEEATASFYKGAKAIFSICSGFVHLTHIITPSVVTIAFAGTENDINGKNPWAPGAQMVLKDEDLNQISQKIISCL